MEYIVNEINKFGRWYQRILTKTLNIKGVFDTLFHHYIEELGLVVFKRVLNEDDC